MASKALGDDELVEKVLDDWRTAPAGDNLRATLSFLEKLTLSPGDVVPEDVTPLRAAGVSDQAIADAIIICANFNVIDRISDSLDFEVPSAKGFADAAPMILKRGYK